MAACLPDIDSQRFGPEVDQIVEDTLFYVLIGFERDPAPSDKSNASPEEDQSDDSSEAAQGRR
jgi:hypothetical protein